MYAATGSRAACRIPGSTAAATDARATNGSRCPGFSNRTRSMPHPLFIPLWKSSTTGRRSYQSTRSHAASAVPAGRSVSSTHSRGSTPAGVAPSASATRTTHRASHGSSASPRQKCGARSRTGPADTRTRATRAAPAGHGRHPHLPLPQGGQVPGVVEQLQADPVPGQGEVLLPLQALALPASPPAGWRSLAARMTKWPPLRNS